MTPPPTDAGTAALLEDHADLPPVDAIAGPTPERDRGLRRFGPTSGAPNARAVLGGSLVAIAVIGVFLLADGGGDEPGAPRVVAARDIQPGSVLEAGDLVVAHLQLPPEVDGNTFEDPAALEGSMVLGPVGEGEVLQRAAVLADSDAVDEEQRPELAIALAGDRALGGALRSGERVDVIATYGSGDGATTRLAATGALVVSASGAEGRSLGPAGTVTVTLSLPAGDVLAVAHAAEAGAVRLVRTTGTDAPLADRYRAGPSETADGEEPAGGGSL